MSNNTQPVEFSIYQPTRCGASEAQARTYHLHTGKSDRRWLVANQPNAADNIYVEGKPGSDGFGGATLSFTLVDGSTIQLKGPWHSNADSLLTDTGLDIRDKYLTQGIVALSREFSKSPYGPNVYTGVLHHDEVAVIGKFNRIRILAQEHADSLGKPVLYAVKSSTGGSSGTIHPATKE